MTGKQVVGALGVLAVGMAAHGQVAALTALDEDLLLGAAFHTGNVTVWPVYSKRPVDPVSADLVPLPDAQSEGWAVVREQGAGDANAPPPPPLNQSAAVPSPSPSANAPSVGPPQQQDSGPQQAVQRPQAVRVPFAPSSSRPAPEQRQRLDALPQQQAVVINGLGRSGPTVNELVIENKGQKPILVLAGTLLKGGNQDRQVGQDFIVPQGKTVPVAAFCVEQGRWTAQRDGRNTGGVFEAKKALAPKSVRGSGQFKGSQSEVWQEVAAENAKAGKAPSTGTFMDTLEDRDPDAQARRDRLAATLGGAFGPLAGPAEAGPVGLAYAIDGKVREVRVFSHPVLFRRLSETLLTTVALEGDLAQREAVAAGRAPVATAADAKQVVDLVQGAGAATEERQKTKAGNPVKMRKSDKTWAAETFADEASVAPATKTYTTAH